jgi:hypothetical protein
MQYVVQRFSVVLVCCPSPRFLNNDERRLTPQRRIIWSRSCVWSLARRFRASQKRMSPS